MQVGALINLSCVDGQARRNGMEDKESRVRFLGGRRRLDGGIRMKKKVEAV